MSKIYDGARGLIGVDATESREFKYCDRVQVDYGTSGVTEIDIYGKLDKYAEWVKSVDTITIENTSEMYIIPEMPFQKLVFTGGDNSQIARAMDITGAIE